MDWTGKGLEDLREVVWLEERGSVGRDWIGRKKFVVVMVGAAVGRGFVGRGWVGRVEQVVFGRMGRV
jgi:hypothetical protein